MNRRGINEIFKIYHNYVDKTLLKRVDDLYNHIFGSLKSSAKLKESKCGLTYKWYESREFVSLLIKKLKDEGFDVEHNHWMEHGYDCDKFVISGWVW